MLVRKDCSGATTCICKTDPADKCSSRCWQTRCCSEGIGCIACASSQQVWHKAKRQPRWLLNDSNSFNNDSMTC